MSPLGRLEAICRAAAPAFGGEPEKWRETVRLLRKPLAAAASVLPVTAAELVALFTLDVGEGPTDPDPGF